MESKNNPPGDLVDNGKYRVETDSMGSVLVPAERLWGAQTQRSLIHFAIGDNRMPKQLYHAYGYVKKAAAIVNAKVGKLSEDKANLIIQAADEVIEGKLDREFPLYVWQTGSGTQSNMNVNEVIANRAIQISGGTLGTKNPIHPNDDVNLSQSSNDTFPTAMHIATIIALSQQLIPQVQQLMDLMWEKAKSWSHIVKIGRTHLQDATPLTVGQEWSGYVAQLHQALERLHQAKKELYELAAGGTAVGTGINTPPNFSTMIAEEIAKLTNHPFITATNKYAAQASLDAMVQASASIRSLAVAFIKIANDIRFLGCGPRAGIHELQLPANEPGSSIMPGKVNPTQEEAMLMVSIQVIGYDNAVAFAGSQGNFELNTMRPIIIYNVLQSISILSDACKSFLQYSIEGIQLNQAKIDQYVNRSLMLVTALTATIGYDKASEIAHLAFKQNLSLKEAAIQSGYIDEIEFDRLVQPEQMVGNPDEDLIQLTKKMDPNAF
ncbi:fumarase, class II [Seinonella peptonophila]|uniref:Fumarate hydratase class II n=1 Tax=Seinonella peptonophila TaxID=112248 RepID=A0A1M5BD39_9BACL|nr:class II fumarate hydratase [Seinonella peptonophila]SHF40335.1 fumarase, class II [Seinonella peptonophila]